MAEINLSFKDFAGDQFSFESSEALINFLSTERDFWTEEIEQITGVTGGSAKKADPNSLHEVFRSVQTLENLLTKVAQVQDEIARSDQDLPHQRINELRAIANRLQPIWLSRENPACESIGQLQAQFGNDAVKGFVSLVFSGNPDTSNRSKRSFHDVVDLLHVTQRP